VVTKRDELWKRMLNVVKPYVTVARVATRPRATTKPPPTPADPADRRFDDSKE
jgi:hypothetical protein